MIRLGAVAAVAGHEIRSIRRGALFWWCAASLVFLSSLMLLWQFETYDALQAELRNTPGSRTFHDIVVASTATLTAWAMIFIYPLVASRCLVEERQRGTLTILYGAPLSAPEIVCGKFTGQLGMAFALALLIGLGPASLSLFFPLDRGQIAAAVIGLFLLGLAICAVAVLCSAVARQLPTAALATLLALLALSFAGEFSATGETPVGRLSLVRQLLPLFDGLVTLAAPLYVVVLSLGALVLATLVTYAERSLP